MSKLYSIGLGVGSQNRNGEWLEVYYPQPLLNPNDTTRTALAQILNYTGGNQAIAVCREQMSALTQALDSVGDTEQADITQHLARSERPLVRSEEHTSELQ